MIRITGLYNVLVCLLALLHRSCDANDDYYVYVDGSAVDNSAAWKSEYTVEGIKYWADYSLQVQSCIQYNNADVIVFSLYEKGYNQCLTGHKPMGTYYVSVPTFAQAYFAQAADNAYHQGLDYTESSLAQYTSCAEFVTDSGTTYYVKLGCASSGVHRLAVNIFTDNTCRNQVTDSSYDSSSAIDVSDIQITFGSCATCVIWFDKTNIQVDDQYWQVHKNDAPLCSLMYQSRSKCDGSCLSTAKSAAKAFVVVKPKMWTNSERWGIAFMFLFGGVLTYSILRMKYLVTKDKLLQNATNEQDLNTQVEVDPVFRNTLIAVVSVIGILSLLLALLKVKTVTWIVMVGSLTILFGYSLKLTVEAGKQPCGSGYGYSSDDDDDDDEEENNKPAEDSGYSAPLISGQQGDAPLETKAEQSGVVA